jgi:urea transporter
MTAARRAAAGAALMATVRPYLRGYSAVIFCNHDLTGLLVLAVTFIRPEVGACGLLAAVAAHLTARHLRYAETEQPPEIYNALLIGLGLGAIWKLSLLLAAIIVVTAVITALATHVLAGWLWRLNRLPVMSFTFVLMMWALILAARDVEVLPLNEHAPFPAFTPHWLNDFFSALGWFLFTAHPAAGLAMFLGMLITSRYLALLCVCGYVVGAGAVWAMGSSVASGVVGYNFMLAPMAVAGLFAFPDRVSFLWGLFTALLSAILTIALTGPLAGLHLPVLAAPFLLASYLVLAGLSSRPAGGSPWLLLHAPALPERSLLAARLARARLGEPGSYPVLMPAFGAWTVSQGIDGPHTHRGAWRDAFDFVIVDERGRSATGDPARLASYHAFGAPVLAPVSGTVWRADDRMADNAPGELDARAGRNFGNHLMLRAVDGAYVLLGHLKQNSLKVRTGEWVEAGQVVAACGNSGRSAQPHLHLHVQTLPDIGAPTRPLHLRSVTVRARDAGPGSGAGDYHLSARPREGEIVAAALSEPRLADALHLPAGRTVAFAADDDTLSTVQVELTLLGQFRLAGARGASTAFDARPDVLAFFDRQGPRDRCLDSLLLAIGLTPFSGSARTWIDAPSAGLAPLSLAERLALLVLRPFGATFDSRYRRDWDETANAWRQSGEHVLKLAPGWTIAVTSEALVDPMTGLRQFAVTHAGRTWRFTQRGSGSLGDVGVPATPA